MFPHAEHRAVCARHLFCILWDSSGVMSHNRSIKTSVLTPTVLSHGGQCRAAQEAMLAQQAGRVSASYRSGEQRLLALHPALFRVARGRDRQNQNG